MLVQSDSAREIWQKDKDHHLHPWQLFDSFHEHGAMVMDRADGAWLYDIDGNRYLDSVGGLWCTNIGQGRTEMVEAVAEQMQKMAYASPFVDMTNAPAAELSSILAELAPGDLNHVMFSCGGSTANDSAFRLIQYYQNCRGKHDKKHIIARDASYHGSTYVATPFITSQAPTIIATAMECLKPNIWIFLSMNWNRKLQRSAPTK